MGAAVLDQPKPVCQASDRSLPHRALRQAVLRGPPAVTDRPAVPEPAGEAPRMSLRSRREDVQVGASAAGFQSWRERLELCLSGRATSSLV